MVAQTRPAIAEAWGVVQYLSGDEKARRLAEYEEMARRDEVDRQKGAFKRGRQKGRQEGIAEVAQNALLMKFPVEDIADLTGLSLEEVNQIAANLKS